MSSRFVSGGVVSGTEDVTASDVAAAAAAQKPESKTSQSKNPQWDTVQKELEEERKRRDETRLKAASGEERSLYDVLQANKGMFKENQRLGLGGYVCNLRFYKMYGLLIISVLCVYVAAKEAAFQEANRLQNQFQSLDDDDVRFLDEVREKRKREEETAKKELADGLKAFNDRRKEEKKDGGGEVGDVLAEGDDAGGEEWAVGRKRRKKERDTVLKRVVSGEQKDKVGDDGLKKEEEKKEAVEQGVKKDEEKKKGGLALVDYGSDSDDE